MKKFDGDEALEEHKKVRLEHKSGSYAASPLTAKPLDVTLAHGRNDEEE